MAKIVILARADPSAWLLAQLRRVTKLPISGLRDALSGKRPLIERRVFGNDHDDAALEILGVVDCLESVGASFELFELGASESLDEVQRESCRLDLPTLKNVLARDYG